MRVKFCQIVVKWEVISKSVFQPQGPTQCKRGQLLLSIGPNLLDKYKFLWHFREFLLEKLYYSSVSQNQENSKTYHFSVTIFRDFTHFDAQIPNIAFSRSRNGRIVQKTEFKIWIFQKTIQISSFSHLTIFFSTVLLRKKKLVKWENDKI